MKILPPIVTIYKVIPEKVEIEKTMKYIEAKIPFDYIEANLLVNNLRQHDIDCHLSGSHSATGYHPAAVSVKIMINEKDIDAAGKIIEEFPLGNKIFFFQIF